MGNWRLAITKLFFLIAAHLLLFKFVGESILFWYNIVAFLTF